MTSYYVYAIQPESIDLPRGIRGFHRDALARLCWRDLAAVVAPHLEGEAPKPTPHRVERHHDVVSRLGERGPVLPVRFGTVFPSCAALSEALKRHAETLHADIERLAGTYEYGITVLWGDYLDDSDGSDGEHLTSAPDNGLAYMYQRLDVYQREQRLRHIAETIEDAAERALRPWAEDVKLQTMRHDDVPLRGSFLVTSWNSAAFEAAFAQFHDDYKPLRMLLTGPWPPYSFVSADYGSVPAHMVR